MAAKTFCDQCGEQIYLAFGYTEYIKVEHRTKPAIFTTLEYMPISGDYCSLECLKEKIETAMAVAKEIDKGAPSAKSGDA